MAIRNVDGKGTIEYPGAVLCTREENGYDDRDWYAIVYDSRTGTLKKEYYDSTRYASTGSAEADATPENASYIKRGNWVRVARGKNVPHGIEGIIFWMETRSYHGNKVTRVGIRSSADGPVYWTYAHNVDVMKDMNMPSKDDIRNRARTLAKSHNWHLPFVKGGNLVL